MGKIIDFLKKDITFKSSKNKKINNLEKELDTLKARNFASAQNYLMNYNNKNTFVKTRDSETFADLTNLKARSRQLANDNALFKHYLTMIDNNVVGKDGFKLQVLAKNEDEQLDVELNKIVLNLFNEWMLKENCDITEQSNFKSMCSIIIRSIATDGEAIVKIVREKSNVNNKFGFKLQMLDTERLDINYNTILANGNTVTMGVEKNEYGKHVAYYIKKYTNTSNVSGIINDNIERVEAKDFIHLYSKETPEQTRGIPFGHAVILDLEDLSEFHSACLSAGKIGASSSIYLERDERVKTSDIADYEEDDVYYSEIGAGQISTLPAGAKFKSFEGKYPSDAYEVYTKRLLQQIAGGLSLSQVFLGNDTEDLNYSTARTVIVEERNYYLTLQSFLIDNLLNRVYKEFLEQAILNKLIFKTNKVSYKKDYYIDLRNLMNHKFVGRRWDGIDPSKEAIANNEDFYNLRKPLSKILAEKGEDLQDVVLQYKQDLTVIKNELGDDYKLFLQLNVHNNEVIKNNNEDLKDNNK